MIIDVQSHDVFRLSDDFVEAFRDREVSWGFGDLSWVTFKRSYSRGGEDWWQTCRRVIDGMFTVQRVHCLEHELAWDSQKARELAREAYERMFAFKWTPPGRGLWMMGTDFVYERGGAALNNCGFVSTQDIADDYAAPFEWMMVMSMLGVGVGFDTRGVGEVTIQPARGSDETYEIEDSREGWADAVGRLLRAYTGDARLPCDWDFSEIRPAGAKLESFGGYASGPDPLRRLITDLECLYDSYVGEEIDARLIVDTMNLIGRCVVAGGIRRSAQIALGNRADRQFVRLKQDEEKVSEYRWVSNNSVFADVGMEYADLADCTADNGEPGYFWLENARAYGRMADEPTWDDASAMGVNPCGEQTLWDRELCTLVETYPAHHDSFEDLQQTMRLAFLYAKTVTLIPTHDERTNAIMGKNRRTGCSMSGIVQAINRHGYRTFINWCDDAYTYIQGLDQAYSEWLDVPESIKTTSVKPSGTVSLLAGATPGVHWDHAPYYLRRIRVSADSRLPGLCEEAGYEVVDDAYSDDTKVISFPVHVERMRRGKSDVSLREKVDLVAELQRYWADNQVSVTAGFDPETEADEIARILAAYETRLKSISLLPYGEHGYEQPPYEEITRERYEELMAGISGIPREQVESDTTPAFCEGCVTDI